MAPGRTLTIRWLHARSGLAQIAQFAAELERYPQAIAIYEDVARTCVENNLLKYRWGGTGGVVGGSRCIVHGWGRDGTGRRGRCTMHMVALHTSPSEEAEGATQDWPAQHAWPRARQGWVGEVSGLPGRAGRKGHAGKAMRGCSDDNPLLSLPHRI